MKQLNVRELTSQLQLRQVRRHLCFDKILEMCFGHIKRHADKNQLFCFYEVPEFMIGMPLYDMNECLAYIIEKLKENDFLVKYYFPRILYISWNINEINEEKLQNNISLIKTIAPSKAPRAKRQPRKNIVCTTAANANTCQPSQTQISPTKVSFVKSVKQFKPSGKLVLDV